MVILDLLLVALIALGAFNGHKKGLVGVVVGRCCTRKYAKNDR